jgi:hypothetical protein
VLCRRWRILDETAALGVRSHARFPRDGWRSPHSISGDHSHAAAQRLAMRGLPGPGPPRSEPRRQLQLQSPAGRAKGVRVDCRADPCFRKLQVWAPRALLSMKRGTPRRSSSATGDQRSRWAPLVANLRAGALFPPETCSGVSAVIQCTTIEPSSSAPRGASANRDSGRARVGRPVLQREISAGRWRRFAASTRSSVMIRHDRGGCGVATGRGLRDRAEPCRRDTSRRGRRRRVGCKREGSGIILGGVRR